MSCLALCVAAISTTFPAILLVRQEVDAFVSAPGLPVWARRWKTFAIFAAVFTLMTACATVIRVS